jgi:hypothetical protein
MSCREYGKQRRFISPSIFVVALYFFFIFVVRAASLCNPKRIVLTRMEQLAALVWRRSAHGLW